MTAVLMALLLTFTANADETLDFKDQVIEGTAPENKDDSNGMRKASPVFGVGKDDLSIDTIVLKRANFNDFHDPQSGRHVEVQTDGGK